MGCELAASGCQNKVWVMAGYFNFCFVWITPPMKAVTFEATESLDFLDNKTCLHSFLGASRWQLYETGSWISWTWDSIQHNSYVFAALL